MMPSRRFLVLGMTMAAAIVLGGGSVAAYADSGPNSGQVVVAPGDQVGGQVSAPTVDLSATQPGTTPTPGGAPAGNGSAPVPCTYVPMDYPAQHVLVGRYFLNLGPLPPGTPPGPGTWVTCGTAAPRWVPAQSGPPPAAPTPAQLAQQAFQQLQLPLPVPHRSPDVHLADGRPATVLGEHVWLWVDRSTWAPQTQRVQAGGAWAEVTATPTVLSFDSGMGASITCPGPGTPYAPSYGLHAASPDCDFVYPQPSDGMSNGETTATYAISWQVTWRGGIGTTPAGGSLPVMISRATDTFAVAEAQALRSG